MTRILSFAILAATLCVNACGSEAPVKIPAPAFDQPAVAGKLQTAVVAGGCFWGVQGVYQHLKGVKSVLSGYAGGERVERGLRIGECGRFGPCRVGADRVRPGAGDLRPDTAGVLFSGA